MAIDADVLVGASEEYPIPLRLVGVPSPKGYCFFLTNLPARIGPLQVGDIYRIRWEVEMSFKLDKGAYRLDEGKGQRVCSIKALLHASLIASVLTGMLVHKHTLQTRPSREGEQRTVAPIHQGLVSKCLRQWSYSIARAFELVGDAADREWERLAGCTMAAYVENQGRLVAYLLDLADEARGLLDQSAASSLLEAVSNSAEARESVRPKDRGRKTNDRRPSSFVFRLSSRSLCLGQLAQCAMQALKLVLHQQLTLAQLAQLDLALADLRIICADLKLALKLLGAAT